METGDDQLLRNSHDSSFFGNAHAALHETRRNKGLNPLAHTMVPCKTTQFTIVNTPLARMQSTPRFQTLLGPATSSTCMSRFNRPSSTHRFGYRTCTTWQSAHTPPLVCYAGNRCTVSPTKKKVSRTSSDFPTAASGARWLSAPQKYPSRTTMEDVLQKAEPAGRG